MKTKNKRKNIKKKRRGFTLIELLAVIIILGVLMIIAIPSVTEYIQSSRKNAYITTVNGYVDATTTKVNSMEYNVMDVEATYYIPTKCIPLEKGGTSPFGDFEESYVVVTYDGMGYDYYYTGRDKTNHGIVLTYRGLLEPDYIETSIKELELKVGVGTREKLIIFSDTCKKGEYTEESATKLIKEKDTLKNGFTQLAEATNKECFGFDSSTGTITDYYCGKASYARLYKVIDVQKCTNYMVSNQGMSENVAKEYCEGDSKTEESLEFKLNNEELTLNDISNLLLYEIVTTTYDQTMMELNVIIPKKINGITVSAIQYGAFASADIYTIEIPETITSIGENAFIYNPMLYNIINKTGKEFNWNNIIGGYSSGTNTFETGTIQMSDCSGKNILKVTNKRVDYNLEGMFESNYEECHKPNYIINLTLKNSKGYNVSYIELCENTWQTIKDGHKFSYLDTMELAYNVTGNVNLTTRLSNRSYEIRPVTCICQDLRLKVEKDGETVWENYFNYRVGCK